MTERGVRHGHGCDGVARVRIARRFGARNEVVAYNDNEDDGGGEGGEGASEGEPARFASLNTAASAIMRICTFSCSAALVAALVMTAVI